MKFNRLRLVGFKSFVEPSEFIIERGLTGIVGPNGCGKSNLVEALRWVMGENSYKNMRASGMDDVIFSGSGNRPARNSAEVGLYLDNSDRTAPAAFNDADEIQVTRRIERGNGSVYRINGKEARAKDVQLLFADASTGARSPSMVGQGRIGELIQAKPQARRQLLEEAAGISGLHSRRHEAELRLRAAETNLERLEDITAQLESQIESLKRQARQANRFKMLSADIRQREALLLHIRFVQAREAENEAAIALNAVTSLVAEKAQAQMEAAKAQAIASLKLPELRDAEAKAGAALQRLQIARSQLDEEADRLSRRRDDLMRRLAQLGEDIRREEQLMADNADVLARLDAEEEELRALLEQSGEEADETKAAFDDAAAKLAESERQFAAVTAEEKGLLGSRYLGAHPPIPAGQIALDLNYDAIAPIGVPESVNVTGAERLSFYPTLEKTAQSFHYEIEPDANPGAGHYYRSDHFSFARVGVPAFSIGAGVKYAGHPKEWGKQQEDEYVEKHYHGTSDEWTPEMDFSTDAAVARFGFALGWQALLAPDTVGWQAGDEFEAARKKSLKAQ